MADDNHTGIPFVRNSGTVTPTPPPHPLDKQWFIHTDGASFGPYTGHQIRQMKDEGRLSEVDNVCPVGGTSWLRVRDDPVLGGLFAPSHYSRPHASTSGPIDAKGGTVVQVTNTISPPNPALFDSGPAAPKSPGLALFLSLLIAGVGQMYNGQVGKGLAFFIGWIFAWAFFLGWVVTIWSMADAYSTAKKMSLRYQRQMLAGC